MNSNYHELSGEEPKKITPKSSRKQLLLNEQESLSPTLLIQEQKKMFSRDDEEAKEVEYYYFNQGMLMPMSGIHRQAGNPMQSLGEANQSV